MKKLFATFIASIVCINAFAQFSDCSSGLLQMPCADMQQECTFMLTNNFLNKHALPADGWNYNTFGYGVNVTFWSRLEITYAMTLIMGNWRPEDPSTLPERDRIIRNQDRHFSLKIQLLKEGDFASWTPSVAIGVVDPPIGNGKWLVISNADGHNDFFNRVYVAVSKHFSTIYGDIGGHLAYLYNQRKGYRLNGPAFALTWNPTWLNGMNQYFSSFRVIAEYDSRTVNLGFMASFWRDHFDLMVELQNLRWFNAGLRYKIVLD